MATQIKNKKEASKDLQQLSQPKKDEILKKIEELKPLKNKIIGNALLKNLTQSNKCQELAEHINTEIDTKNSLERMLVDQIAAIHKLAMAVLSNVYDEPTGITGISNISKTAMRMIEVCQKGALTLHKLQTGGKQTVIVKHQNVQVNEGGQAVIANDFNKNTGEGLQGK